MSNIRYNISPQNGRISENTALYFLLGKIFQEAFHFRRRDEKTCRK
jgi:hypothetical protein